MVIVHILVDCRDAMGANAVNTMAETIAPRVESLSGGTVILRIISNLAVHRLARVSATFTPGEMSDSGDDPVRGAEVIEGVIQAYHFAAADPFRATTHNKGIMNVGFDKNMLIKQVKLSVPMGVQEMMIAIGWSVFYKIMAIIGIIELATTQLLFTIMHASFMPALGVGQACATLVGKYMGSKQIEKSEASIRESLRIAEYIMGSMGIVFILFPEQILMLFTNDQNIIDIGIWGLRLIGLIQFVDAIAFTMFLALTGAGNTLYPALVESLLIWFFMLPVSYYFGVLNNSGFKGPWLVFAVYLLFLATILAIKVKKGDWKEIEV